MSINGPQSVRIEKGTIVFKIFLKKYQLHLKYMLIFSLIQGALKFMKVLTQRNIKITFLVVLLTKLYVLMINLLSHIFVFRGENPAYEFIKAILKEYEYCKKIIRKCFNKKLIMSEKEEEQFQLSNTCWICEKTH